MIAPMPPRYLSVDEALAINEAVLSREGRTSTLLQPGLLQGALARPQMAAEYEQADVVTQAAVLIAAIALAHAFVDGNKRTALIAGAVFLDLNGYSIDAAPSDDALGRQIEAFVAASGARDAAFQRLVAWLHAHVTPPKL